MESGETGDTGGIVSGEPSGIGSGLPGRISGVLVDKALHDHSYPLRRPAWAMSGQRRIGGRPSSPTGPSEEGPRKKEERIEESSANPRSVAATLLSNSGLDENEKSGVSLDEAMPVEALSEDYGNVAQVGKEELQKEIVKLLHENSKLRRQLEEERAEKVQMKTELKETKTELKETKKSLKNLVAEHNKLTLSAKSMEIRQNVAYAEFMEHNTVSNLTPRRPRSDLTKKLFSMATVQLQNIRCKHLDKAVEEQIGSCSEADAVIREKTALIRKYCKRIGIPEKELPKLSPEDSLSLITSLNLTFSQFKLLKHEFLSKGMDILAPTHKIDKTRKKLSDAVKYVIREEPYLRTVNNKTETTTTVVAEMENVEEVLTRRVQMLLDAKKLCLEGKFDGKLWLCVVGDKGGTTTKLSVFIGNVARPNSYKNHLLCGIYEGEDTKDNLRNYLGNVSQQIDRLHTINVVIDGVQVQLPILLFGTGDFKFVWAILGFKAGRHVSICFKCYAKRRLIREGEDKCACARTITSYFTDCLTGQNGVLKGVEPMFRNIPLNRWIPCLMHIISGLADLAFLDYLFEKAEKLDFENAKVKEKESKRRLSFSKRMKNEIEEVDEQLSLSKCKVQQLQREHSDMGIAKECMESIQASLIVPCDSRLCDHPTCLARHKHSTKLTDHLQNEIACDVCDKWYHYCCELLFTAEDIAKASDQDTYVCRACATTKQCSITDRIGTINDQQKELEDEIQKAKQEEAIIALKKKELAISAKQKKGAHVQLLEKNLQRAGADVRAFHQKLTGNHIYNLLRGNGPDIVFEMFENTSIPKDEISERKQLMRLLAKIQSFGSTKDLSDAEKTEYKQVLVEFDERLAKVEGDHNRTPKLHSLLVHTPEFIDEFGSLGTMSEQGGESQHRHINQLEMRFASVRNKRERRRLVLNEYAREVFINDKKNEDIEWWKDEKNEQTQCNADAMEVDD